VAHNTQSKLAISLASLLAALAMNGTALSQAFPGTAADANRELKLDANSPFRDPNIIYLDADELERNEEDGVLTAKGDVEGRYQDRTLRIDADGSVQYADKLELSNELEAGTASDFTARLSNGGITGAALATRTDSGEIELYNAYYTACEPCQKPHTSPILTQALDGPAAG